MKLFFMLHALLRSFWALVVAGWWRFCAWSFECKTGEGYRGWGFFKTCLVLSVCLGRWGFSVGPWFLTIDKDGDIHAIFGKESKLAFGPYPREPMYRKCAPDCPGNCDNR